MIASMDRADFLETFGGVYEHSRWVAETVYDANGHANAESAIDLADVLASAVNDAGEGPQFALLIAHPDLAGKLAKTGELTDESTSEQASAGLDKCTPAEFDLFTQLNTDYKEKFNFPYILAVRGRNRHEILENFQARLPNDHDTEFATALEQVHQIARLRLQAIDEA